MLKDFGGIALMMLVGFFFPIITIFVARLVSPKSKPNPEQTATYECGLETIGETWVRFKTSYFLYALVFVVFDVETVFLYPWAVKFQMLGTYAFVEMFVFIAILVVGFWYAWKEGALEWK